MYSDVVQTLTSDFVRSAKRQSGFVTTERLHEAVAVAAGNAIKLLTTATPADVAPAEPSNPAGPSDAVTVQLPSSNEPEVDNVL